MTRAPAKTELRIRVAAAICALAGFALFQFFGNATRGYVNTSSTFWWWISQWIDPQAETQHGWLILGISLWLLWRNVRGRLSGRSVEGSRMTAMRSSPPTTTGARVPDGSGGNALVPFAVIVLALGLHALGFIAQQTRISIVAAIIFAWGVLRLGGGRRWGDAAMVPLAFLVFAIPVNVLDSLGFWLRMWVVAAAEGVTHVAGIDVVRSGTQLFAPDGRYQYDVAAACSGVRSLIALIALSFLIGYLQFESFWRRTLVVLLCFPLIYFGNVVRIVAIVVAANAGGQRWGERVHDGMGFGVFLIVLGGLLLAARLLQSAWPEAKCHPLDDTLPGEDGDVATGAEGKAQGGLHLAVAVAVVGLVGLEMFFLARVASVPASSSSGIRLEADGRNPVGLPTFIGTEWIGRDSIVTVVERGILPADTGFSRRRYLSVQDRAHTVFMSIVLSGRDRTSIHRPELCLVGQGWTLSAAGRHAFSRGGRRDVVPATLLRTTMAEPRSQQQVRALVAYFFVGSDAVVATHMQRFLHDAWNRVLHRRADRWAYILLQADAADGDAAALKRIQAVLDGALPAVLVQRGP